MYKDNKHTIIKVNIFSTIYINIFLNDSTLIIIKLVNDYKIYYLYRLFVYNR